MKKLASLLALALLLSACTAVDTTSMVPEGEYTDGIYELTFQTKSISNQFVGNDWSFTYTFDGEVITSGHQIVNSLGKLTFLPVYVEIREADKIDDVATGVIRIAIADGGSGKTEITVIEEGGRFAGNTAVWEVSCKVKLVGKQ